MRTFKIKKVKTVNPKTKAIGFSARVQTHARITFEQIAEEMCENTTLNPAEALMSARLLVKKIAARVQEGYIVEIGELGSLQPIMLKRLGCHQRRTHQGYGQAIGLLPRE